MTGLYLPLGLGLLATGAVAWLLVLVVLTAFLCRGVVSAVRAIRHRRPQHTAPPLMPASPAPSFWPSLWPAAGLPRHAPEEMAWCGAEQRQRLSLFDIDGTVTCLECGHCTPGDQ